MIFWFGFVAIAILAIWVPWLKPGAVVNVEEIVAEPGPSWNVWEFGHMLQSKMQLSWMAAVRIDSREVSKPVSIITKDFVVVSAWAGE
jgi:hypothetical protein